YLEVSQSQLLEPRWPNLAKEQAGIGLVFNLLWKLVPERVFLPGEPNFRKLADEMLASTTGVELDVDARRALTLIYKRLRQQHFEGRAATSLDLTKIEHSRVLDLQAGRCSLCGYLFTRSDIDLYLEDDYVLRRPHIPVIPNEVVMESIMTSP